MADPSTASSPPTSSPSAPPQDRDHGSSPSSNLYLVTFLATLFLLLFVSCAIVLRSYVLRQRYNRRINEAMAAGLFLAPRAQGSKRKRFGVRPSFDEAWLAPGGPKWDRISPLSAQPIMVKRRLRDGHVPKLPLPPGASFDPSSPDPARIFPTLNASSSSSPPGALSPPRAHHPNNSTQDNAASGVSLRSRVTGFFSHRHRRAPSGIDDDEQEGDGIPLVAAPPQNPSALSVVPPSNPAPHAAPTGGGTPAGYKIRVEMLQVAVLIAMPSPTHLQRKNARLDRSGINEEPLSSDDEDEEEEEEERYRPLPELVVGVARVRYPAAGATVKSATAVQSQGRGGLGSRVTPPSTAGMLAAPSAAGVGEIGLEQMDVGVEEGEELGDEDEEVALDVADPPSPVPPVPVIVDVQQQQQRALAVML
ncbi:hypothetical protein BDN70DRAFT_891697 [Pholiota conissans]|uniref:Uncharacterized protein n=1 Tax=Pholiota conissans TaxID=109636 RepID=A0A9P5ZBH4_9AGAR|nr:hypothetical protein BDN70DRAFT_891697 [Pholiota conissans]